MSAERLSEQELDLEVIRSKSVLPPILAAHKQLRLVQLVLALLAPLAQTQVTALLEASLHVAGESTELAPVLTGLEGRQQVEI